MSEPAQPPKTQEERDAEKRMMEEASERRLADLTSSLVSYGPALASNPHIRPSFLNKHNIKPVVTVLTRVLRTYVTDHVERVVRENVVRGVEGLVWTELVEGLRDIFDTEFMDDCYEDIRQTAFEAYLRHMGDYRITREEAWAQGTKRWSEMQ